MQSLFKKKKKRRKKGKGKEKPKHFITSKKENNFFLNYIILWATKWCEFARLSLFSAIPTAVILVNVEALLTSISQT